MFFENFVAEVMDCMGDYSALSVKRAMMNSIMLSSDVSAAHDPIYASASSPRNQAEFGKGIVFNKYTELVERVDVTMRMQNISH